MPHDQNIPTDFKKELAARCQHARLQKRWTRLNLADRAGVNQYTLKRFERSGDISLKDYLKLVHAFDCLDDLKGFMKPRISVNQQNWRFELPKTKQRGREQKECEVPLSR